MDKITFSERKIILGYKSIILGLCLYILEFLLLPVYGVLQKIQVSGNGFYTNFWLYTGQQPYPIILSLTGFIILLGIALLVMGYKERKKQL